jgi:CIC family chloride channel protein
LAAGRLPGVPLSPAPFAIVGMMALFGSIAHAPLAVMLMVAEMTGNLSLLAPAMVALGLATLVVGEETIYTSQLGTRADSPVHRYRYSFPVLGTLPARAATAAPEAVLRDDATVAAAADALAEHSLRAAPVLDAGGAFTGVARLDVLRDLPLDEKAATPLSHVVQAVPAIAPGDTLDIALQQMADSALSFVPVVEPATGRLAGVVTVAGALQAYRDAVRRGTRRLGSAVQGTTMVEARVEPAAALAWTKLSAAGIPPGVVVMALRRHGDVIIPRGDTTLQPGDVLTLVVSPSAEDALHDWLATRSQPATTDGAAPVTSGAAGR